MVIDFLIGQRVIYYGEIATTIYPPAHAQGKVNDEHNFWIMRPSVGYESYVARSILKPLLNNQV